MMPDLSEWSRCISMHWSLPVQCDLSCTHRENWHETWRPDTDNRLRYRRAFGTFRTEELVDGEWTLLDIPPPVSEHDELLSKLTEAEGDRDRARDAAVALEQENAYLTELTATCTCYDGDTQNYEGVHVDCAVHGAVRAYNETQATVERVRELHAKFVCGCGDDHGIGCKECRDSEYPCPTIRTLDGGETP